MTILRSKPLPLAAQLMQLKRRFPDGAGEVRRDRLTWHQVIQPHALAHSYRCRLEFAHRKYPSMLCIDPPLTVLAAGRRLPHVLTTTEPVRMCLFMLRSECWRDSMVLANVVVPLAFYWLSNFEDWLFSGVWRGGGTHPVEPDVPSGLPVFPSQLLDSLSSDGSPRTSDDELSSFRTLVPLE